MSDYKLTNLYQAIEHKMLLYLDNQALAFSRGSET